MKRVVLGLVVAATGLLGFGPVFAATIGVSSGASATETAVRGAAQTQINPPPPPPAPTARYRVTIDVTFAPSTHPGTAPGNAHVSPPVVATHRSPGAMFVVGALASPGIEAMAETGATSPLVPELNAHPAVASVQVSSGVTGVGTRTVFVDLTHDVDQVSLVTMLAPSPDWFVGVADVDLLGSGGWVPSVSLPLGAYDAGTDSGANFTSPNADTQPPLPISGPRDPAFAASAAQHPFGTVTITRIG